MVAHVIIPALGRQSQKDFYISMTLSGRKEGEEKGRKRKKGRKEAGQVWWCILIIPSIQVAKAAR
jgi:hypothetical protein